MVSSLSGVDRRSRVLFGELIEEKLAELLSDPDRDLEAVVKDLALADGPTSAL